MTAEAPRRLRAPTWVGLALALIVAAWLAGFVWFAETMPGDTPTPSSS